MQNVSSAYKKSMKAIGRNRGYIRVTIGIFNSEAQENVRLDTGQTNMMYFASGKNLFNGTLPQQIYAMPEQDFSRIDGTMYFLPPEDAGFTYYYNGVVTETLADFVRIDFGGNTGYNIKGLTIDFGDCYPVDFSVESDSGIKYYEGNTKRVFTTEDGFPDTSYFIIRASRLVNGDGRLRIYQFSTGITNTFTNKETINYSSTEYVSSISETVPSQDVSVTVYNENQYYSPDNPDSAFAYLEIGQEVSVAFGYDVFGDGNIEWLPPNTAYLKSWDADQLEATFTATDRFDNMSGTYYRGLYRPEGISLYDLALDVLADAGITDYYLDSYLKDVIVKNPMPAVGHASALQIIANAGRCSLSEDRSSRVHIQSSFIPRRTASTNNETEYSDVTAVVKAGEKDFYAEPSQDFSMVDGSLYFMPAGEKTLQTGYISESVYIVREVTGELPRRLGFRLGSPDMQVLGVNSGMWQGETPKIIIDFETSYVPYGMTIQFRNTAPKEFSIVTYDNGVFVEERTVSSPGLVYDTDELFQQFDKMEIVFTKGYPNSRIFVDSISFGDTTDYSLRRDTELTGYPKATRQERVKSINVVRSLYTQGTENKSLITEQVKVPEDGYLYTVYLRNPADRLTVTVNSPETVTAQITDSSNYYATIEFSGVTGETNVEFSVFGYEFDVAEQEYVVEHNERGEVKRWSNPLISDVSHAQDLESWLASFFLGDVEYDVTWRGDPRVDANDLFLLETSVGTPTIRAYQNELTFNGAWSGHIKARKVVL